VACRSLTGPETAFARKIGVNDSGPNRKGLRGVWSVARSLGVVVRFGLRSLNPWLNAPSDTKFWGAVVFLAVPLVFAVFALIRAIVPSKRR
jgi:hypothetical protein